MMCTLNFKLKFAEALSEQTYKELSIYELFARGGSRVSRQKCQYHKLSQSSSVTQIKLAILEYEQNKFAYRNFVFKFHGLGIC